ncbi:MAG: LytR C-terminal domain-containing protein [Acidimicrobiia bacterium]
MTSIAHARGRSASDRLLRTAARGGILIGVAVVIGIVLLQVVEEGSPLPGSASGNGNGKVTTTTGSDARVPQEVIVAVYNASGVSQAAGVQANKLRGLGYQTPTVENAAQEQTGSTVACLAGYEKEAEQLLTVVANSTIVEFPAAPPAGAEFVNCIVVVGK